ncbi:MAG: hypothetical protein JWO38_4469, partial [Gemmataceae bacterium]|nr:hypothetical protein [Gemmataceae bacterium]
GARTRTGRPGAWFGRPARVGIGRRGPWASRGDGHGRGGGAGGGAGSGAGWGGAAEGWVYWTGDPPGGHEGRIPSFHHGGSSRSSPLKKGKSRAKRSLFNWRFSPRSWSSSCRNASTRSVAVACMAFQYPTCCRRSRFSLRNRVTSSRNSAISARNWATMSRTANGVVPARTGLPRRSSMTIPCYPKRENQGKARAEENGLGEAIQVAKRRHPRVRSGRADGGGDGCRPNAGSSG